MRTSLRMVIDEIFNYMSFEFQRMLDYEQLVACVSSNLLPRSNVMGVNQNTTKGRFEYSDI